MSPIEGPIDPRPVWAINMQGQLCRGDFSSHVPLFLPPLWLFPQAIYTVRSTLPGVRFLCGWSMECWRDGGRAAMQQWGYWWGVMEGKMENKKTAKNPYLKMDTVLCSERHPWLSFSNILLSLMYRNGPQAETVSSGKTVEKKIENKYLYSYKPLGYRPILLKNRHRGFNAWKFLNSFTTTLQKLRSIKYPDIIFFSI